MVYRAWPGKRRVCTKSTRSGVGTSAAADRYDAKPLRLLSCRRQAANNNNNNISNNNSKTMFMVLSSCQSHCESSPGSFDECRTTPSGRRPKTKPDDLGCESACTGCQSLHPPSAFIIITRPESWYSFYRFTEGSWLVTYRDGLPVHRRSTILVLTGSDVAQLRWSRPTRYHSAKPPTNVRHAVSLIV